MNVRNIAIISILLVGMGGLAFAQEVTFQVRALLHDPAKPDAQFFVGKLGETMVPLKLSEEGFGDPQKVSTENGSLNLYASAKVDKENPQSSLAATVKVSPGSTSLMLIILPAAKGTPAYRIIALDDGPQSFPWGECKAINLTPVDFAVEIGEHRILVPGGKITAVPKVTKVDEFNRAQSNFYYKQEDQWVVAAERQMQFAPALRRIFLIYKAPEALAPDVRTIVDSPSPVLDKPH